MTYNPSAVGRKNKLFGYPYSIDESLLAIIPVPWDVTTSFVDGTSNGPKSILEASPQLDLSVFGVKTPWIYPVALDKEVVSNPVELRQLAKGVIENLEEGDEVNINDIALINKRCAEMVEAVYRRSAEHLHKSKKVAVLGGDHSTPLGLMNALADQYEYGILQIDAHMDLRQAYEGFEYSHASIMYNALKHDSIQSLVQVGIRDYCEEEEQYIAASDKQISVFYDDAMHRQLMIGKTWDNIVKEIIDVLPEQVYVSFDIDGLEPSLCPQTGTPVPGGLSFNQAMYLIDEVVRSRRKIIGFDLCEVGNEAWDANVGARVLYRLSVAMGISQGTISHAS
ncbi:MAG: agmatinase family protein [Cyclobacteriaceae bacterium]